jgi:hypothetical protein
MGEKLQDWSGAFSLSIFASILQGKDNLGFRECLKGIMLKSKLQVLKSFFVCLFWPYWGFNSGPHLLGKHFTT